MKNLAILILACLLTGGVAYYAAVRPNAPDPATGPQPLKTESDFRNKLAEMRMNREKLERSITKLEKRKTENVNFLKEKGITSVASAEGDPSALMAIRNLKGWTESINKLKEQFGIYDSTISRLEGMLTKIERDMINESATLTEEQEIEMRALIRGLDEKLKIDEDNPLVDAELDSLLQDELGSD